MSSDGTADRAVLYRAAQRAQGNFLTRIHGAPAQTVDFDCYYPRTESRYVAVTSPATRRSSTARPLEGHNIQ